MARATKSYRNRFVRPLRVEPLEHRELLSIDLLPGGHLSILGTDRPDHAHVWIADGEVWAQQVTDLPGGAHNFETLHKPIAQVSDIIFRGLAGNDSFTNDTSLASAAYGEAGQDWLYGGAGNDTLDGGADGDTLSGRGGNDRLLGQGANDTLYGGPGSDRLYGGLGADALDGGTGNDYLYGEQDADTLSGGAGIDRLYGGLGADALDGGAGNDYLYGEQDADTLSGGAGNDRLDGGAGNDVLNGGAGVDILYGQAGNDELHGGTGTDNLFGGAGNDLMFGEVDLDYMYGGDDDDTLYGGDGADVLNGQSGNDTLYGYDPREVTSDLSSDEMLGGAGNDVLYGGLGNDYLYGEADNDSLYGGYGNDRLDGGAGNDQLHGQAGNDSLHGEEGNDYLYAGMGGDGLFGGNGDDILVTIDGDTNDHLWGNAGTDSFWFDKEGWWIFATTDTVHDASAYEQAYNLHAVKEFENGADKTLNGDNLVDPSDGSNYLNFSNRPLFAAAGPSQTDIDQGELGDCWLMAALGAAAKANPNSIRQTVVDLGDSTYAVELDGDFYRVDGQLPTVSATNSTLLYAGLGGQGSIWVPIVEKAYAFYRTGANTYASLRNGLPSETFEAIGCNGAATESFSNASDALNYIASQLASGKAVAAGIFTAAPGSGLQGSHAYQVERVNYQTIYVGGTAVSVPVSVVLRNPWADDADPNDGVNNQLLTVTGEQLVASDYDIESAWVV